jgi:hypothetical protein
MRCYGRTGIEIEFEKLINCIRLSNKHAIIATASHFVNFRYAYKHNEQLRVAVKIIKQCSTGDFPVSL